MKKVITLVFLAFLSITGIQAQCTSGATAYDLTVNSMVTLAPTATPYTFGIVCAGGHLIDSAMCCTRMIHIEGGGIYEAGPSAYGIVWVKSGGTFDAHGNTSFFNVYADAGATILNYTGPLSLCSPVIFASGLCVPTGIVDNATSAVVKTYPNPANDVLRLENTFSADAIISIYDITGKMVKEVSLSESEMNVSTLAAGMYTFSISLEGQKVSNGKFAIVR